jgi:hypothetical protein
MFLFTPRRVTPALEDRDVMIRDVVTRDVVLRDVVLRN